MAMVAGKKVESKSGMHATDGCLDGDQNRKGVSGRGKIHGWNGAFLGEEFTALCPNEVFGIWR